MKSAQDQTLKPPASSTLAGFDVDSLPIRVRQADLARLLGLTRQRVSQMVADGWIPIAAGGRIDPSAAASALIQREREGAQLKVLPEIREQLNTLERERDEARAALASASARIETLVEELSEAAANSARLARRAIDAEHAMQIFAPDEDPLADRLTACYATAMNASLERITAEGIDPELLEIARADPPTAAQEQDRHAWSIENLEAEAPPVDDDGESIEALQARVDQLKAAERAAK